MQPLFYLQIFDIKSTMAFLYYIKLLDKSENFILFVFFI